MGDRTWCSLHLAGCLQTQQAWEELYGMMEDEYALLGGLTGEETDIVSDGDFQFEEVNYGEIPSYIKDFLIENEISYIWNWGRGDQYEAGTEVWDARTGWHGAGPVVDGEYFLLFSDLDNLEKRQHIETLTKVEAEIGKTGLYVAKSAHDKVRIISQHSDLQDYYAKD